VKNILFGVMFLFLCGCQTTQFQEGALANDAAPKMSKNLSRQTHAEDFLIAQQVKIYLNGEFHSRARKGKSGDQIIVPAPMYVDLDIYFENVLKRDLSINLQSIADYAGDQLFLVFKGPKQIVLIPDSVQHIQVLNHPYFHGDNFSLFFIFEHNGKRLTKLMPIARMTKDEWEVYTEEK